LGLGQIRRRPRLTGIRAAALATPGEVRETNACGPVAGKVPTNQRVVRQWVDRAGSNPLAFAQDRHKRAARAVLCALVLDDERPDCWRDTAVILSVRLTDHELTGLALAALLALDPAARELVFDAAQAGGV
jgi:hypothetical protein